MSHPNSAVRVGSLFLLVFCVTTFCRQASIAGQAAGGFFATSSMMTPRESHAAALLPNGWVLIAGGQAVVSQQNCCTFAPLSSAELYNPSTGTFTATGSMTIARAFPVAVTLPSGKVFVADGKSADLYDPSSASFSATGSPDFSNSFISAVLLKTGKVLLTDGSSAELYDSSSGTVAPTGSPQEPRRAFSTTLLNSGEVLIAGGSWGGYNATLSSAELYDPSNGTFALTGSMTHARHDHVAALIGGSTAQASDVFIAGGYSPTPNPGGPNLGVEGAELYNPTTGQFTFDPNPYGPAFGGTATTLSDGRVLIAGGAGTNDGGGGTENLAAVYDPSSTPPQRIGGITTLQARAFPSATLLTNGEVLVAGGDSGGIPNRPGCCTQLASAELFDESAGSAVHIWAPTSGLWSLGSTVVHVWADSSVESIKVYIDKKNLSFSAPFIDLDATALSDGPHSLLAIGFAGAPQRTNLGSDSIIINVANHQVGIVSADGTDAVATARFDQIGKDLIAAESNRSALETQEDLVQQQKFDALPVGNDSEISDLKNQLAKAEAEQASLAATHNATYPPLAEAATRAMYLRERIARGQQRVAGDIDLAFINAVKREKKLRAELALQRATVLRQQDTAAQFATLAHQAEKDREIYNSALDRMNVLSGVVDGLDSAVFATSRATVPSSPSGPSRLRYFAIATTMGFMAAVFFAIVSDLTDARLKSAADVERYLNTGALATVPNFKKSVSGNHSSSTELAAAAAEAYRQLRSAVLFTSDGQRRRSVLVTSAVDGEGKTITAVNTLMALAQLGLRVVLVDADLRHPGCHRSFGLENRRGLADVLKGGLGLDDAIVATPVEDVFVIPAGAAPAGDTTDLVGSVAMADLIQALRQKFDFVVVDSPPLTVAGDAATLGAMIDAAVLVVDASVTSRETVIAARSQLSGIGPRLLGVVLNRAVIEPAAFTHLNGSVSATSFPEMTKETEPQEVTAASSAYSDEGAGTTRAL